MIFKNYKFEETIMVGVFGVASKISEIKSSEQGSIREYGQTNQQMEWTHY